MSLLNRRPGLRWLVPLLAVIVVTTAGSVIAAVTASARDSLPPRSAAQLLVDVQKARLDDGLSGTIVQSASLGLPSLPGPEGDQSSSFSSLVSGSHTLRVWYAGPSRVRVALLGQLGESDLVRNGSDVWIWSSHNNTAHHLTIPAGSDRADPSGMSAEQAMTPQQAADAALKAITPTTRVTTDPTAEVAGRSAYQLVLEPQDPGTLIGHVTIAIDGETHIPTRVQVFGRGTTAPAFETGFTSFNASTPPSSVFDFNPPPGATVTEGLGGTDGPADGHTLAETAGATGGTPQVIGKGWTTIVKADLPANTSNGDNSGPFGNLTTITKSLPTVSGSWGSGHLLRGTLFSVLVTDRGQVVAGAVAPEQLYSALEAP
jgi:outer membrane lipoprotein-sorting protein